jgi:hypothetical protein
MKDRGDGEVVKILENLKARRKGQQLFSKSSD